jgi:hypothetical protein
MESAFHSQDLRKDPCATFIRTDGVLLDVRNRKEECRIWSLVATTNHIIALKLTASWGLIIESLFSHVQYSLDFPNSACISFTPAQVYSLVHIYL